MILLIHRSVGRQLLDACSELRSNVDDIDINKAELTTKLGEVRTLPLPVKDTEPEDLIKLVNHLASEHIFQNYTHVALKSCYSSLSLRAEAVSLNLSTWEAIITRVAEIGLIPIVVTPPPRRPSTSLAARHQNDVEFVAQLVSLAVKHGVPHFDLHGILADDPGYLKKQYRRRLPVDGHPNLNGAEVAGKMLARYLSDVLDPA